jgi:hypothetical protein
MSAHLRFLDGDEWRGSFLVDRPIDVLSAIELGLDSEIVILSSRAQSDLAYYALRVGQSLATIAIFACASAPPEREQEVLVRGVDGFARRAYWSLFDLLSIL